MQFNNQCTLAAMRSLLHAKKGSRDDAGTLKNLSLFLPSALCIHGEGYGHHVATIENGLQPPLLLGVCEGDTLLLPCGVHLRMSIL